MELANKFKHDFSKGDFRLSNKNGHVIFYENSDKYWQKYERDRYGYVKFCEDSNGKREGTPKNRIVIKDPSSIAQFFNHDFNKGSFELYNKKGNVIFRENSDKSWARFERDENGKITFCIDSDKRWQRFELDENGNVTFWRDSSGDVFGTSRQKETEPVKTESFLKNWLNNPENGMHNVVNFTIEDVEQILEDFKNTLNNGR